jgi:hypothetical protein
MNARNKQFPSSWWLNMSREEIRKENEFERMFDEMLKSKQEDIQNFKFPKIHSLEER